MLGISAEAKKSQVENSQRAEWLKYKGMDTFEAMKLYIEKVKLLASIYPEQELEAEARVEQAA